MTTSIVRTITPIIVGWLLGLPIAPAVLDVLGVTGDQAAAAISSAVAAVAAAAWYVAARLLERARPAIFGWLLGSPQQPTYSRDGA